MVPGGHGEGADDRGIGDAAGAEMEMKEEVGGFAWRFMGCPGRRLTVAVAVEGRPAAGAGRESGTRGKGGGGGTAVVARAVRSRSGGAWS